MKTPPHNHAISIGPVELGTLPRIAVPLVDRELGEIQSALRWADIVELRVDMCDATDESAVAESCRKAAATAPLLVTVRSHDQGGAIELDDQRRLALYEAAMPHADAVDVELRSPIRDAVLERARSRGVTTIVSHHDFAATPDRDELDALVAEARQVDADIAKLAATANDAGDRNRLLDVLRANRERAMIVIAMGAHGAASRVFFPLCGSVLTYGFLHDSVAPGQLSIRELRAELARYCPGLKASRDG